MYKNITITIMYINIMIRLFSTLISRNNIVKLINLKKAVKIILST